MPNGKTWARILAAGALAVLLLALGWAVANGLDEDDAASQAPATRETAVTTTRPKPTTRPVARARFVKLTAAGAFDPEGDGHERDEEASLAVDGDRSTFWRTERYSRFFKTGVGLVLDAGRRVRVRQVVVDSATPGVRAEIRIGSSRTGPFTRVSPAKTLTARTTFPVAGRTGRYVVVWVTALPPESAGEVAEVRVRAT
jgi:putative peptidoglycan lipid II flippase